MIQLGTKSAAANNGQSGASVTKAKLRRTTSHETKAKLSATMKARWAKRKPMVEVRGETESATEQMSVVNLGGVNYTTEAGQQITWVAATSELSTGSPDNAGQVASTALVLATQTDSQPVVDEGFVTPAPFSFPELALLESEQIAQIPQSTTSIPVYSQDGVEQMTDERLDLYICVYMWPRYRVQEKPGSRCRRPCRKKEPTRAQGMRGEVERIREVYGGDVRFMGGPPSTKLERIPSTWTAHPQSSRNGRHQLQQAGRPGLAPILQRRSALVWRT
jgi:hypothetical protein